jgi:hypothetical protein
MLWNIIFSQYLPEAFSLENFRMNIPAIVLAGENVFRILTFGFTVFLMLGLRDRTQKAGLILYIGGVILYFASWAAQMFLPDAIWSLKRFHCPGFHAYHLAAGDRFSGKRAGD